MKIERTIRIERPVAETFAFTCEPSNLPRWQSTVSGVNGPGGPVAPGSRFGEIRHFGGRRFETSVEVTHYVPDTLFAVRVDGGPVPISVTHRFESLPGATDLTVAVEGSPRGALRLAAMAMAKAGEHALDEDLHRLKRIIEHEETHPAAEPGEPPR